MAWFDRRLAVGAVLVLAVLVGAGAPTHASVGTPPLHATVRASSLRAIGPGPPIAARVVTHPLAPAAGPTPAYSGHYYVGSVDDGTSTTSSEVQVDLAVPDDAPESDSFYYVILSVWDNAGSYDQLGLTNDYGTWGLAYSWTAPCGADYYYSPDAVDLHAGLTYLFAMSIAAGIVDFAVSYAANSTPVWSLSAPTGGTAFELEGAYTCDDEAYYDYTDYEEVYDSPGALVPYDFWFTDNVADGTSESSWSTWNSSGAPSGPTTGLNGSSATIENEPYFLTFARGPTGPDDTLTIETDEFEQSFDWPFSVEAIGPSVSVSVSSAGAPVGWGVNFSSTSGDTSFASEVLLDVPGATPTGTYLVELNGTTTGGEYDRIALRVAVVPGLSIALAASPPSGDRDVGQPLELTSGRAGGIGPFEFAWSALPAGCSSLNRSAFTCTPTADGFYIVELVVTDARGYEVEGTLVYLIDSDPTVLLEDLSGTVEQGNPLALYALAGGGSLDYSYNWSGLPNGCLSRDAPELNCTPSSSGTYEVIVTVHDSNGGAGSDLIVVSVVPPLFGFPFEVAVTLVVIVAVAVALVLTVALRRRRRKTATSPIGPGPAGSVPVGAVTADSSAGAFAPTLCSHCAAPIPDGARYCGACGVSRDVR